MSALQDKYVNPLTDFGFKKLFGTEPNKALLIDLLNQVLPERHQITELTYAKNEQLGSGELDRKAIFDLYCIGKNGERFIVEIQKVKQNFFKDRSIYYASFPIQEQAKKGEWDYKLEPVYTVGILDFIFDEHKSDSELLHTVELKNQRCEVFYDKLKFIYIELPKFQKTEAELVTHFDKWLYVFRHLANLQNRPKALQEKIFDRLFEAAEIAKFSPKDREVYEGSLKYYRDLNNILNTAKQEAMTTGREEGIKEGIKEGREKGIKEEKARVKKEKTDTARQMKADGLPTSKISLYTGLSQTEVEEL